VRACHAHEPEIGGLKQNHILRSLRLDKIQGMTSCLKPSGV